MKWLYIFFAPFFLIASSQQQLYDLFGISDLNGVREKWIQQGKERWVFDQRYEDLKETVWPLFRELGMVEEIKPARKHYDTVVLLGALYSTFQRRLDYLVNTGVTYDRIVLLSGERPLLDSEKAKLPGLSTEAEMVQWVYDHSPLSKDISALFISVPMKGERRPTTFDTILAWLETKPNPKWCLVISTQPYVHYQGAVFNRIFPFYTEMAGPAITGSPTVALMLDTLGREIFFREGDIEWLLQ
ncbi:MAG: hypothetical protein K1X28_01170 [Parachlamydiales bacterium]|nr:hypothetical protein [Parachlamydiales bacterium]